MNIDLLNLQPQTISKNLRGKFLMVYGLPKVGKTTLLSKFEKCLICSFEPGTNALNNVYVQPVNSWTDWKKMIKQLKMPQVQEKFATLGIDTADLAWEACVKWICNENNVEKIGDIPYGQGYDMAKKEFRETFKELAFMGYGLVFVSHSDEKVFKDEKGEEYTQICPALPKRPYDVINKMVDIIAYLRRIKINDTEKTYMFFRGNDRFLAGSRYKYMVDKIEFSYENLVQAIYDAIDKEVENSGGLHQATNEENPYYLKSFDDLMIEAKELWGEMVRSNRQKEILSILKEVFGKEIKFSDITENEQDKLIVALDKIKEIK